MEDAFPVPPGPPQTGCLHISELVPGSWCPWVQGGRRPWAPRMPAQCLRGRPSPVPQQHQSRGARFSPGGSITPTLLLGFPRLRVHPPPTPRASLRDAWLQRQLAWLRRSPDPSPPFLAYVARMRWRLWPGEAFPGSVQNPPALPGHTRLLQDGGPQGVGDPGLAKQGKPRYDLMVVVWSLSRVWLFVTP